MKQGNPRLIAIMGDDDESDFMKETIKEVEEDAELKIKWFNIGKRMNFEMFDALASGNCRGAPFFYNRDTHFWICGATSYENLRDWAEGEEPSEYLPPPMTEEEFETLQRVTGFDARFKKWLDRIKARGQAKMT